MVKPPGWIWLVLFILVFIVAPVIYTVVRFWPW